MKTYEKIFSKIFILTMLGCIVFRIESWPFSDWRVYSEKSHPRFVAFYEVTAKVDDEIVYPLDGNSLDLTVDRQFRLLNLDPSHPKTRHLCAQTIKDVLAYLRAEYIRVIRYTVDDDMNKIETEFCYWSKKSGMKEISR